jgi:N utilization substance protein B
VLQGLYEGQLSGNSTEAIRARLAADTNFAKADPTYFDALWSGVNAEYEALIETIAGSIDRRVSQLSPVERAVLVIGTWELKHRVEIRIGSSSTKRSSSPSYGGTDGHSFVNGVLDKLAPALRAPGRRTAPPEPARPE